MYDEEQLQGFYKGRFESMTKESFEASIGVTTFVFLFITRTYSVSVLDLFITLYFLKNYPIFQAFHWIFDLDESTCSKLIWRTINLLDTRIPKLELEFRLQNRERCQGLFEDIMLVVDGTERPIERPEDDENQRDFYSGKKKTHTVKNQIIVDIFRGFILDFTPAITGCTHDSTIFKCWLHDNSYRLLPSEIILADKGYQGNIRIFSPFKDTTDTVEQEINFRINKVRVIVENSIGRLKKFRAVKEEWRHELGHLNEVFSVCCKLTNMDIQDRPLRRHLHPLLFE